MAGRKKMSLHFLFDFMIMREEAEGGKGEEAVREEEEQPSCAQTCVSCASFGLFVQLIKHLYVAQLVVVVIVVVHTWSDQMVG